jgi:hypothetical protein
MSHLAQVHRTGNLSKLSLFIILTVVLFTACSALAVEKPRQGDDLLLDTYHRNEARLDRSSLGVPLCLESAEHEGRVHVDVYGIFDHPFSSVLSALKVPANWCDIVALHPNVKACTYRELPGTWRLTFYLGRKVYQSPEDARQLIYHYRNIEQRQGYLDIVLRADEGPFGTKDHQMRLEAMPLDGDRTFVHVSYEYSDNAALRLAEKLYFSTLGWGKAGFTVTGTDRKGNPVYIGGPRGALERNAVRYYLAVQSFMDTLHYPEESRFSMATGSWYDHTDRYKKQLYEMEKKDYLTFKKQEHKNQDMLQQRILKGLH